jgi:AraC-like DNA-binding protein
MSELTAVCSRSYRDALKRIGLSKQLTCPEEIRVRTKGDETTVEFVFLQAENREPDVLVDVCLAWVLFIGQRGTDSQITPLRLELMRPQQNRELLENHFGCRVTFNAERNAIVFPTPDVNRQFVTYNEELLKILGAQLDSEIEARRAASNIEAQVRHTLQRSLAGRRPSLRDVAQQLHLSARTLQRRLTDEGLTFKKVVEDTRRELARQYLGQNTVELSEAAFLLGYEDANSFFRAFHDGGHVPWRMALAASRSRRRCGTTLRAAPRKNGSVTCRRNRRGRHQPFISKVIGPLPHNRFL